MFLLIHRSFSCRTIGKIYNYVYRNAEKDYPSSISKASENSNCTFPLSTVIVQVQSEFLSYSCPSEYPGELIVPGESGLEIVNPLTHGSSAGFWACSPVMKSTYQMVNDRFIRTHNNNSRNVQIKLTVKLFLPT